MSLVNNDTSLSAIMDTIDLGPTGSVQMMFAKLQLAQSEICKAQAEDYMKQIENIQEEQELCAKMIEEARNCQQLGEDGKGVGKKKHQRHKNHRQGLLPHVAGVGRLHERARTQLSQQRQGLYPRQG